MLWNDLPGVLEENIGVNEIVSPHHQPLALRVRAKQPTHMMYEEDDLELDKDWSSRAIVLHVLHQGLKFIISNTMMQLLNLKGMFRDAAANNVN